MRHIVFLSLLLIILANFAYANEIINSSNTTILLNTSLLAPNNTVIFSPYSSNNIIDCRGNGIYSQNIAVLFSNYTYNNTIENCTIYGKILSMHDAQNNLLNISGEYNLSFVDNSSNIALGNFFKLILMSTGNNYTIGRFIQIMPKIFSEKLPYLVSMNQNLNNFIVGAHEENIPIPRFGLFPNTSCNYSCTYPIEALQISKNKTINFNPFYYDTPYWGFDILGYTTFNITPQSGFTYRPTFIMPWIYQNEIFPQNKPIYWNYTIVFHNYTKWDKLRLLNGWQGDPNATLAAEFYNISSGFFSYKVGIQKPGVYEF
ncbi:MAG: hypothetical protein ACP5LH_03435, partial [Candidatus Micrarchaeia archaeon]